MSGGIKGIAYALDESESASGLFECKIYDKWRNTRSCTFKGIYKTRSMPTGMSLEYPRVKRINEPLLLSAMPVHPIFLYFYFAPLISCELHARQVDQ